MSGNAGGGEPPLPEALTGCCEPRSLISGHSFSLVCEQLVFHLQNSSRELSRTLGEIKVDVQGVYAKVCLASLIQDEVNRDDKLIFGHDLRRLNGQGTYGLREIRVEHLVEP